MKHAKRVHVLTWITFYVFCAAISITVFLYELPLPEKRLTLSNMEFVASDSEFIDNIPTNRWVSTTLPDNWRNRDKQNQKFLNGWYRTQITLDAVGDQLWAILIPSARMNIAVYLNGKLLGDGGRFSDPVARSWMTPLFFPISSDLLQRDQNELHIRLKADRPGMGFLSKLYIAPYKQLVSSYDTHYFVRITSVQIITILLFAQSIGIGLLWLFRRHEVYYGYYALATLLWGLHNLNIFVIHIPVSTLLWDWFAFTTINFYVFISVIFFHRFFNETIPKIEIPMLVFILICASILLSLDEEYFYLFGLYVWYPAGSIIGLYAVLYFGINAWKRRDTELQIITASGIFALIYSTHDNLVLRNVLDWEDGFFIQYAAMILLTGFAIILLRRFASSLDEAETLNRELEQRVEVKHQQLVKKHAKLQVLENQRILTEERERLVLDMHDGLGGSLVSTLAMIDLGKASMDDIAEALRVSLDDLNLMIHSMDIQEDELSGLLGNFRARMTSRLHNSNIQLVWNVQDIPNIPGFNPRSALQVLRILQEAVTNTLKHAQASKIWISAYSSISNTDSYVMIEIRDNGRGNKETNKFGRGTRNMYRRALRLGSKLSIKSGSSGTVIQLMVPVDKK